MTHTAPNYGVVFFLWEDVFIISVRGGVPSVWNSAPTCRSLGSNRHSRHTASRVVL